MYSIVCWCEQQSCDLLLTLANNSTEPCSLMLICESNPEAHNYVATTPFACLRAALWSSSRCSRCENPMLWLTVKMRLRIRILVHYHLISQPTQTCMMIIRSSYWQLLGSYCIIYFKHNFGTRIYCHHTQWLCHTGISSLAHKTFHIIMHIILCRYVCILVVVVALQSQCIRNLSTLTA